MIKNSLLIATILFSGMADAENFFGGMDNSESLRFTYNMQGENIAVVSNNFTYHEIIDPITDKNSSYIVYNSPYQNRATKKNPFEENLTWGMRIGCLTARPKISFTIDYGHTYDYPTEGQLGSIRPTPNQGSYLGATGTGTTSFHDRDSVGINYNDRNNYSNQKYYTAQKLIGKGNSLEVIYRMDKEKPVGFSTWRAQRSGNVITIHVPENIIKEFMKEVVKKNKITVRVRGKELKTYTYSLNGMDDLVGKLPCANDIEPPIPEEQN